MRHIRRGKVGILAWGVSLGLHLLLLTGFAAVRFTEPEQTAEPCGAVSIQQIQRFQQIHQLPDEPLVTPKPEVRQEPLREEKPVATSEAIIPLPVKSEPVKTTRPVPVTNDVSGGEEFFGHKNVAQSVCFVTDCSGSMYGRLGMIRRQLKDCIASLQDTQSFYLIFFMDGDTLHETGGGRLLSATGQTKADAFAMIDKVRLSGQTNAYSALKRALQLRDIQGRSVQVIYFLTDGFDIQSDGRTVLTADIKELRNKYAPSAVINTIGFWSSPEDQSRLKEIAEVTGGTFLNIE